MQKKKKSGVASVSGQLTCVCECVCIMRNIFIFISLQDYLQCILDGLGGDTRAEQTRRTTYPLGR